MLRRLPLLLLTTLPLASCTTAEREAPRLVGVPLAPWSAADQAMAEREIIKACGSQPVRCPGSAVLERATLDYVKLRALVRAANGDKP